MNPRSAINFFRSPVGAFAGFCALVVIALIVAHHFHKPKQGQSLQLVSSAAAAQAPQLVESVQENMQPYNPPPDQRTSTRTGAKEKREQIPTLPPISIFNYSPTKKSQALSQMYAPYGRLIPCELVVTVDSAEIRTPIIGLTSEDVYHAGRLIIPAGTEVHGVAEVDRERERIGSGDRWILVLPNGQELTVSGIALDRETNPDGTGWGITDGSAGLRGQLIKSDNLAEIKLFAASFLSAAGATLNQNQQTLLGYQLLPNTQNAALAGAQSVLGAYAKQIYDSIQQNGFYVRVPAGKQFYLYVTQTIDRNDAATGESRSEPNGINKPQPSPSARQTFPPVQPMQP